VGSNDVWGVSLVQAQEFTVVTTITSSRRGILSVLGSIGGAYSIVCVSLAACAHFCRGSGVALQGLEGGL
jgi:hypothetical protein